MFKVKAETIINSPADMVWEVLTNVEAYKEWSTMLHYEGGLLAKGETIALKLALPSGTSYRFSPQVIDLIPHKRFAWRAITGIKGIFDGEHIFELVAIDQNKTRLVNYEIYSGLLSPVMKHLPMMKDAPAGFVAMNNEIKARAERFNH